MTIIIVNNFAHRMLQNGTFESAQVSANQDGDRVILSDSWSSTRSFQDMNLYDGEIAIVYDILRRLSTIPFADVPVVTLAEERPVDMTAPR